MSARLMLAVIIAFTAAVPAGAESFKSWATQGAREERERDLKAAFSSYSNALSMWEEDDGSPGKAKVLCARAGLREKDGDDAGALADLSACLALDKKNSKAFHRRGALLLKSGKTQAAIGDFYRAIAIDIRFAQAYADRARAYESQGEKGFAREDYRQACSLGEKTSCAKAKALAPKTAAKGKAKPKDPEAAPADEPPVEPAAETKDEARPESVEVSRAPSVKKKSSSSYRPKFRDCLASVGSCVENGDSFGACVNAAPNCDVKAVKGCCPAACLKAYQKAINLERSEADAYREHFAADSACGMPPKEEEDN